MVTKREKIEDYYGLNISVEPVEEKPFYLSGDQPSFKTVIENPSKKNRFGKILLEWNLVAVSTHRVVKFKLEGNQTKEYEIPREWLYREGTATYVLIIMPKPPEDYNDQDIKSAAGIHTLCSYYVRDKDLHKYEKNYRLTMMACSLIIVVLTIINLMSLIFGEKLLLFFQNFFFN